MSAPKAFASAEEAWFWTCRAIKVREGHAEPSGLTFPYRPCSPEDVVGALDGLYRRRRIGNDHARVLRYWGNIGTTPDQKWAEVLWHEAMTRLDFVLRRKGIVA